jgi:pimeloyl-ACP methyl ester carboxylesterase
MAEALKEHFTVVMYDRRGFSRSYLSGAQDYEHRIEVDADDAERLIKHLSDQPATVIGNSSGAIVSFELLTRHPDIVRTLVAHEPPAISLLPDSEQLWAAQKDIYDTYRAAGVAPAAEKFGVLVKAGAEAPHLAAGMDARNGPFIGQNVQYWFERELLTYPFRDLNMSQLADSKDKLLLVNGRDSHREALQYRANLTLADMLGLPAVSHVPGMHVGFASHAKEFALELMRLLRKKDEFYATL